MKPTLQAGLESRVTLTGDRERTIDFMGENARVYATPMRVRDIEMTSRDLLLTHLDPGEDSVGTRVEAICRGRHQRFVVDVKTTETRLAAKVQKAGLACT